MIEGDLNQSYREFVLKHSGFDIVNSCGMWGVWEWVVSSE
jgi:hypothetical protein